MKQITKFEFPYFFLSNFYLAPVTYDGVEYPSTEHAYQAAKTLDLTSRELIRNEPLPGRAKRMGRKVKMREDWESIKLQVMEDLLREKFTRHTDLRQQLLDTGDAELIEGNNWGDRFWGVDGHGANHLGRLLMKVRSELRGQS